MIFPWELDREDEELAWAVGFLESKEFPSYVWKRPDGTLLLQIKSLIKWLQGSRNWIVCFSASPLYMRRLYTYLAAVWACSTLSRADIMDVDMLVSAVFDSDGDLRDSLEHTDLLILPYADPEHSGLRKCKGSLANVLQRRKLKELATITDLYIPKIDRGQSANYISYAELLKDSFGSLVHDLFSGESVKYVGVTQQIPKREEPNEQRRGRKPVRQLGSPAAE